MVLVEFHRFHMEWNARVLSHPNSGKRFFSVMKVPYGMN